MSTSRLSFVTLDFFDALGRTTTKRRLAAPGKIFPINPNYGDIDGLKCHPAIADVGQPIDLAIVIIPARAVLGACAAFDDRVRDRDGREQRDRVFHQRPGIRAVFERDNLLLAGLSVGEYVVTAAISASFSAMRIFHRSSCSS